jgi:hypothetical protein
MGFIPKDAKWYLADLIVEHRIEADKQNVIHINTVLVRADSPKEAHEKAMELGRQCKRRYANTDRKTVSVIFLGLGELDVIHDELEHGAELMYSERVGLSENEVRSLIKPKSKLGVFAPIRRKKVPNYMPKSVMDKLIKLGFDKH